MTTLPISGCDVRREAADWGYATRSFPLAELDDKTLDFAERAAKVPIEQLNKRSSDASR
ncbi:hypothetical protein [Bradyrhizobium monzae]|uniref:hypothetical protein n=1 Tax=Bradyrhizobium sp. Oc8 TaxID=2876780 RepID=UPI001F178E48|nr:hypothetical protein [Bradyrhizobium sp. Oc8]